MSILVFLVGVPASFALTINPQNAVKCDITSCYVSVDLAKYITPNQLLAVKSYDISHLLEQRSTPNMTLNYSWSGSNLIITAKIKPGTSNYWSLPLVQAEIDPWFNSSWTNCRNLTINNTIGINKTNEMIFYNATNLTFANPYELRLINASCGNDGSQMTWSPISNTSTSVFLGFNMTSLANTAYNWSLYYNNSAGTDENYGLVILYDNFSAATLSGQWKNFSWSSYVFAGDLINITTVDQPASPAWVNGIYNNTTTFTPPYTIISKQLVRSTETGMGMFQATETSDRRRASMVINGANYYSFYCNAAGSGCSYDSANIGGTTGVWYRFKIYVDNTTAHNSTIFTDSTNAILINKQYAGKEDLSAHGIYFGAQSPAERYEIDYAGVFKGQVNIYNVSSVVNQAAEETAPAAPRTWSPVIDSTVVCFKTQPVCINLKDNSLIYRGKGYV